MAEKKIGTRHFKVDPMLATAAMVMQARLLRLAGPAISRLGEIMDGYGKDKSPEDKARSNLVAVQAFSDIFASCEPEELADLIKELCELARIKRDNGEYMQVDFDGDFTSHQAEIIPVVVWVLREQFADFFSGLSAIGNLAK